jgi:hypothetical protein
MACGIASPQDSDERLNITFHPVAGARNYGPPIGATTNPARSLWPTGRIRKRKKKWSLLHGRFFARLVGSAKLISKEGK